MNCTFSRSHERKQERINTIGSSENVNERHCFLANIEIGGVASFNNFSNMSFADSPFSLSFTIIRTFMQLVEHSARSVIKKKLLYYRKRSEHLLIACGHFNRIHSIWSICTLQQVTEHLQWELDAWEPECSDTICLRSKRTRTKCSGTGSQVGIYPALILVLDAQNRSDHIDSVRYHTALRQPNYITMRIFVMNSWNVAGFNQILLSIWMQFMVFLAFRPPQSLHMNA